MIYHDCKGISLIIHVVLKFFFILAPMILEMPVDKGVCPGPGHPLPSLTPGGMLHRVGVGFSQEESHENVEIHECAYDDSNNDAYDNNNSDDNNNMI